MWFSLIFVFLQLLIYPFYLLLNSSKNLKITFMYVVSLIFCEILFYFSLNKSIGFILLNPYIFFNIVWIIGFLFYFDRKNIFENRKIKNSIAFCIFIFFEFLLSFLSIFLDNGSNSWAYTLFYNMILIWILFVCFNFMIIFKIIKIFWKNYIDPAIKNINNNKK